MTNNQRYQDLYVQRRRLMSMNARENADRINQLGLEMKGLVDAGGCLSEGD